MPGILHTVAVTWSCRVYCTQWRSPGQRYIVPGMPHTVALHLAGYTTHSGSHLVMPGIPHTVAVTWSQLCHARYTAHGGGHLVMSCQVYCTKWRLPGHSYAMPGILHTVAVAWSCQVYHTQWRSPGYARYATHSGSHLVIPGIL